MKHTKKRRLNRILQRSVIDVFSIQNIIWHRYYKIKHNLKLLSLKFNND